MGGIVVGRLERTIENRVDDVSGETGLLVEVQMVWNLWSVRIVGPRRMLHIPPHDPNLYQGGLRRGRVEGGEEGVPNGERSGARRWQG